jgi:O-antigen ligase
LESSKPGAARHFGLLAAALPGFYLLLTSTGNLLPAFELYDSKRILQFVLLFLLFLLPCLSRDIRIAFGALLTSAPGWMLAVLAAVFTWGMLSALVHAQSPLHLFNALSDVGLLACLCLAAFVVAACRATAGRRFDQLALGLIALTGIAVALQELVGIAATRAAGLDFSFEIALMYFSWPRFFNQVQSWTIPVLAALPLLFTRRHMVLPSCALALALNWYVIFATGARGSFVAVTAATLFAAALFPSVRRRMAGWQSAGMVLGLLVFAAVFFFLEGPGREPTATAELDGSSQPADSRFLESSLGRPMAHTSGRTELWKAAGHYIRNYPILGIGPMGYACTSNEPVGHPHNFVLQLAAEWGVPAALAVCGLFLAVMLRLFGRLRQSGAADDRNQTLAVLLYTGVLSAALHATLSGVLVMPASQVTGMLVCGMLLGLPIAGRSPPDTVTRTGRRAARVALACMLLLSSGLIALGAHELSTLQDRAARLGADEPIRPRMWQDAKVCRLYTQTVPVSN